MSKNMEISRYNMKNKDCESVLVSYFESFDNQDAYFTEPHWDDRYVLLFHQHGQSRFIVDFTEVNVVGPAIMVIFPGQVHFRIATTQSSAYSVGLEASLIDERFSDVFHRGTTQNLPIPISNEVSAILKNTVLLLEDVRTNLKSARFYEKTLGSLAETYVTTFASLFSIATYGAIEKELRFFTITKEFKQLLSKKIKDMKSPKQYASALNLSTSYLNEAVKEVTGSTVSYWIQKEIIWEAKRVLFYTDFTLEEIATVLGYPDRTHFIRTFSRLTKLSPLQFRKQYRR